MEETSPNPAMADRNHVEKQNSFPEIHYARTTHAGGNDCQGIPVGNDHGATESA